MWNTLVTIPLQLVCQLVVQGNNGTENASFESRLSEIDNYGLKNSAPSTRLPEGYTAFPDIGFAYKYYSDEVTWDSARKNCLAEGASLAELDTFRKIKHALELKNENNKYGLFVGIHRLFDNVEWTSLKTGRQLVMIPWGSVSNDESPEYKCMVMYFDGQGLTADDCTVTYRYVCEIPLPVD